MSISASIESIIAETTRATRGAALTYLLRTPRHEILPALKYAMTSKAACDRGLVVRLGHEAFGRDWHPILPAMVAAELMDFAVIITDDILDHAPRRMAKEAHYVRFGQDTTIITANILKSLGSLALLDCLSALRLTPDQVGHAMKIYEEDHVGIYVGQFLDITFESLTLKEVSVSDVLTMMRFTTGVQIGAMAALGAILAGASEGQIDRMRSLGTILGTVFQIRDDFVDYIENESATGKTPFLDWSRRKKRFPLTLAVNVLPSVDARRLRALFGKVRLSESERARVVGYLTAPCVRKAALRQIGRMHAAAERLAGSLHARGVQISGLLELLDIGCRL